MTDIPHKTFQLKGLHVLGLFVGFFLLVIAVDTGFTVMAIRTFPGEVSRTPYEDGVAYNAKLAQLNAQARLGWRAAARAEAGRRNAFLAETAPGTYSGRLGALSGAWDLSLVAHDKAGARFEAERRLTWP